MSDSEDLINDQVARDNYHFKALLDLVPAASYFSVEEKDEIWGNNDDSGMEEGEAYHRKKKKKHKKKGTLNPLSTMSITQITELRQKGETLASRVNTKQTNSNLKQTETDEDGTPDTNEIDTKHQRKKQSRSSKGNNKKHKEKELQRREVRLEELREKLKVKLEEIKARKNVTPQEQKKLKRQEKKVNAKLKNKQNNHKDDRQAMQLAEGLWSPPQNRILNNNGEPIRSRFDFSMFSTGNDKSHRNELHGRDYKRLLGKMEKRQEKVETLKSKDLEAGKKLEERMKWSNVISKAQGEKVKDDPVLLQKALKRKEKMKVKRQKKWQERSKTVDELKEKRQYKRQTNINKRKTDKKEKTRKKLIKKGRIIPGF